LGQLTETVRHQVVVNARVLDVLVVRPASFAPQNSLLTQTRAAEILQWRACIAPQKFLSVQTHTGEIL
jgi:hypothetical protein